MADYNATTMSDLIVLGGTLGFNATIDKELVRFGIATGHADPDLASKLAAASPAIVDFLASQLVLAIYNHA